MQPDHSVKIEEIILRYKGQAITRTLAVQIYKEIAPYLGDLSEHIDRQTVFDNQQRKLNLTLKAKTPLGKILLDMIGSAAEEIK